MRSTRLALALAACVAGCGGDTETAEFRPVPEPSVKGESASDRESARRLARYFRRSDIYVDWYRSIESFRVEDGVIEVRTTLPLSSDFERQAREICDTIQGSDVADFTPGHRVSGQGGVSVRCPRRRERRRGSTHS